MARGKSDSGKPVDKKVPARKAADKKSAARKSGAKAARASAAAGKGAKKAADKSARNGPDNGRAFAATLRQRLVESILPGEPPLSDQHLDEAAGFLLEAAGQRAEGRAALLVRSAAGARRFMRIAIVNADMPFLVDSVAAAVAAQGLTIDLLLHPTLPVRRDEAGGLVAIRADGGAGEKREALIYIETARLDAKDRRALEAELIAAIEDTRAAVADWPKMRALIEEDADRLRDAEGAALLRWLGGGMMTHLGHFTRRRDGRTSAQLGVCRRNPRDFALESICEAAFAWFDGDGGGEEAGSTPGRAPLVIKANLISRVHRRVRFDLFITPLYEEGRVEALSIHAGLWTSAALASAPAEIPVLRQQLAMIADRLGFDASGHDHKALVHALTVLPRDLLISFSLDDVTRIASAMIGLAERLRPRVALVPSALGRHLYAFVWLSRDMLLSSVRQQIAELLETQTGSPVLDWSLTVEGGNLALLRFVLDHRGQQEPDAAAIDERLQQMLRGWPDAVEHALAGRGEDAGRAAAIAARYAESFPAYYRVAYGPEEAALDIGRLRRLAASPEQLPLGRDARLYADGEGAADRLRLKIYQQPGHLPLSDAVPALENFGFRVLLEQPHALAGEIAGTIHDFTLGLPEGLEASVVLARAAIIEQAIAAAINACAEDDVFNRLIVTSALDAGEADLLRAFYRYLRQANIAFTIHTVVDALTHAPGVTRGLVDLFRAHHDPDFAGEREDAARAADEAIRAGLLDVVAINDDRLLRLYRESMAAVLRTNFYASSGADALAFKLDSARVPGLAKPVPWREIFVYSRRVEGIHLRAGPVARGGIRWSDRRDDFRTEVLGLLKAQRVKNAVIVPTGAKGGFYPKRLPNPAQDRDAWFAEGRESYALFIRALLSITDNIVDNKVVHPEGVVIHDDDDPYFVVAADKGTASFSDLANAIAGERDFWLGDAFASGGSQGYDHKAMGITARGAWISVQRHFREMGVDVQSESVRVAGCGDMSGDVFGNGMLRSKAIRLVAAFDHRHIFIDPDPDPEASWEERQRLYDLPRSSWADYDAAKLSKGGGIYPRSAKRITPDARALEVLGIAETELTDGGLDPESLIAAILKSPVDLLWFGGIGTYLKAASESHVDVGDPANDALRVNAEDVRARVIGEGANLGVTQAARIAYALGGGRINADFIDNSAGVDCSDNEVNIKIALADARRAGRLSEERRIALLADMTEDVAALVLENNRMQTLALSMAERGGAPAVASQIRVIDVLEDTSDFDPQTAGLGDRASLTRRATDGLGLTRPELAVLLSNSKLVLQDAIEAGDLAADETATPLLTGDFPPRMQEKFRKQLLGHRLRREIVATTAANQIVNRMGLVHPFELAEEEGVGLAEIAASFLMVRDLLAMDRVWAALDDAEMPEEARLMGFEQAALAMRGHMADLLRAGGCQGPPTQFIAEIGAIVRDLNTSLESLLGEEARKRATSIAALLTGAGAPGDIASMVARLFAMDGAIGIARLSLHCQIDCAELTRAFIALGMRLRLDWAQAQAATMNPSDPWERLLVAGLARDFQQMRLDFLRGLAARRPRDSEIADKLEHWIAAHRPAIGRFRAMVGRAQGSASVSASTLAQLGSQARNLLKG